MTASTQPATTRLPHYDVLRGIAILCVLMAHVLLFGLGREFGQSFAFVLVNSIDLPLFFMLSGHFSYRSSGTRQFAAPPLARRARQLLPPLLSFVVLITLWKYPQNFTAELTDTLFKSSKSGYWFPLCLMQVVAIYWLLAPLLSRLRRLAWQLGATLAAALALYALPAALNAAGLGVLVGLLGLNFLNVYFTAFMVGVFCSKHNRQLQRLMQREWARAAVLVLFALALLLRTHPLPPLPLHLTLLGQELALPLVLCIAMLLLFTGTARDWCRREFAPGHKPGIAVRTLIILGTHSFEIYLLHYFFMFPAQGLSPMLRSTGMQFVPLMVVSGAIALCLAGVSLLAMHLITRSRILAQLLLGHRPAQ